MDDDTYIYSPEPDPPPARRHFGGLGRIPAALLAAGGLMVGGGIGGFVIASAASTPGATVTPSPTPSPTTHHCQHPGAAGSSATGAAYY